MPDEVQAAPVINIIYKIQAELIFERKFLGFLRTDYVPTQFNVFPLKIRIKNISDIVFPGGKIRNIRIKSSEGINLEHSIKKEINIPALDPGESKDLFIDKFSTPINKNVWITASIVPNNPSDKINTYQFDKINNEPIIYEDANGSIMPNEWGESFFVKSNTEALQLRTNYLIALLTLLTVLQGVLGLNNIFKWLISALASALIFVGKLFISSGNLIK